MPWTIQVEHADGTAADDATVTVLSEDEYDAFCQSLFDIPRISTGLPPHPAPYEAFFANCSHAGNGRYPDPNPKAVEGAYILLVRCGGHSPVHQRLEYGANDQPLYAGRDDSGQPAQLRSWCVEVKAAGGTPRNWTIHVKLMLQSEVVMMAGNDEASDPAQHFTNTARARRTDLVNIQRIDAGTIVTIYSCEHGAPDHTQRAYVRAFTKQLTWMRIHSVDHEDQTFSNPDMTFCALYRHLSEVGGDAERRHRVREVSIFTHSWRLGPILSNTGEGNHRRRLTRHPGDRDARTKDLCQPLLNDWPHVRDAFAPSSVLHVWGCAEFSRMSRLAASANFERSRRPADQVYDYRPLQGPGQPSEYQERTSIHDIDRLVSQELSDASYPARWAMLLRNLHGARAPRVIAAAPGTWSRPAGSRFEIEPDAGYHAMIQYLASQHPTRLQITSGVDGDRYIDYMPFQGIGIPNSRPSSEKYYYHRSFDGRGATIGFYGWRAPFHERFSNTTGSDPTITPVLWDTATNTVVTTATITTVNATMYEFSLLPGGNAETYVARYQIPMTEVEVWRRNAEGRYESVEVPLYLPGQSRP